ncbi:baseplate J/gp47 family protein [Cryptosporangium minutisporangium]|uniref:Baseplate protein J-like domain-containing protein n=1 Tax=Cryptosporangium minutisporangium TaxID=113569 RepID=A0ABP6T0P2_9ACTN
MRPSLDAHRSREHSGLLAAMAADGRRRARSLPRPWDPVRQEPTELADHGRGLLDAYALGLHVLWVYQEAWADEGFLGTARLPSSVRRLLDQVGHAGDPGFAAEGLQHFRCREGEPVTLPPGFRVRAEAVGNTPAAVYETTRALRLSPVLNELRATLPAAPTGPAAPSSAGAIADALLEPEIMVGPPEVAGAVALTDSIGQRFAVARAGSLAQRNAGRARQQALGLADLVSRLRAAGAEALCSDVFEQLCAELCAVQELANQAGYEPAPGPLSESQELLLTLLRDLATRQPDAVEALGGALARQEDETDAAFSGRLDRLAAFLDALVGRLLQEARDQVVRLRGPRALETLDRSLGANPPGAPVPGRGSGTAAPGTDALFLLPVGNPPQDPGTLLRPGDWLVVADESTEDPPTRTYREAVQVVRLRRQALPGTSSPATRVTFAPPLTRRYDLATTVLLGNVAEITHGTTVTETTAWTGDDAHLPLTAGPLTWIRSASPDAAGGRVPAVELSVAGRGWSRVDDLRHRAGTAAFAVEVAADATGRLRLAEATGGVGAAAVPVGAEVTVIYRTGVGAEGNRPALAVAAAAGAEPAVAATFNPLPVSGGVDPEDADAARARAEAGTHAPGRAVSAGDVRALALAFGGVRRAAVLRDPIRRRDHVTVVIAAEGGADLDPADAARLRSFLVARTPPGTAVTVVDRNVVPVRMRLVLRIEPGADPLAVVRSTRLRLGADAEPGEPPGLLHPERAELGRGLAVSAVYGALAGLPGLASVLVDLLYRDGTAPARHDRIAAGPAALVAWAAVTAGGADPLDLVWEEASDR